MAEDTEWLAPLLENLVNATQDQQGYTREDLDHLLDLFSEFARGVTTAGASDAAITALSRIGESLVQALEEVNRAERNPVTSRWDEALVCWQQAAHELVRFFSDAGQQHNRDLAYTAGGLELWVHTVGEIYCVLRLSLDPWADLTGHSSEVLLQQVDAIEAEVLQYWGSNRYQVFTLLKQRYSQWARFARRRGWVAEAEALDYLVQRTRMRTLAAYLRHGRSIIEPSLVLAAETGPSGQPAATPPHRLWSRLGVLGRLSVDMFYYATAGFGYRPGRLVVINIVIVLVCGLVYWAGGLLTPLNPDPLRGLLQAEYFSALSFMLAALGEITPTGTLGQFLIVLESLWGFLMISVVIAIVVNRNTGAAG